MPALRDVEAGARSFEQVAPDARHVEGRHPPIVVHRKHTRGF